MVLATVLVTSRVDRRFVPSPLVTRKLLHRTSAQYSAREHNSIIKWLLWRWSNTNRLMSSLAGLTELQYELPQRMMTTNASFLKDSTD